MASVGVAPSACRLREGTTHTTGVEGLPQEMNDMIIRDDKVLGTPTREEIKCMNPNYTEYKFPQIKAHTWHKIFQKRMPPEAVDLVSTLLQYHFPAMALRRLVGFSDGELMRSDCKPCSTLMNQTARISTVGGGLGFWILCRLHYGPRVTVPRSLRWAACGAVSISSSTALLVRLFSPECEPQNIDAYDKGTQQY